MSKVYIVMAGMFTTVRGGEIPVETWDGPYDSIPDAADQLSRYFNESATPENVESQGYKIVSVDD